MDEFGYKTHHISSEYHVVRGKFGHDRASFSVERNDDIYSPYKKQIWIDRHPGSFDKQLARLPINYEHNLNDARFQTFNKSPDVVNKHVSGVFIDKFTERNIHQTLLPLKEF